MTPKTAPLPDAPAIAVQSLIKHYGDTKAVDGIDFVIPRGKTYALLGGNGAGKSTTIAMLLGLLLPPSGDIHVFGHDILQNRFAALSMMNFSSPYVELPGRLTVEENLRIYARLYGIENREDKIAELCDRLDLTALRKRPSGKLSSGQKTRVMIAKSLLNDPQLLLLDEPTASLDPDTADWMRGYLEEYQARTSCTILLASHNMPEVERLCDFVLMMKTGKIVDRGTPQELIARYGHENLEQVFLSIARGKNREQGDAA